MSVGDVIGFFSVLSAPTCFIDLPPLVGYSLELPGTRYQKYYAPPVLVVVAVVLFVVVYIVVVVATVVVAVSNSNTE